MSRMHTDTILIEKPYQLGMCLLERETRRKNVGMTDTQQKFLFTGYLSEWETAIRQSRAFTVSLANDKSSEHIRLWDENSNYLGVYQGRH